MKKVLCFYRTFFQTLNPGSYEGFAESRIKNTLSYYFSLIFNALIILFLLMIPILIQMPSTLESKFSSINAFNVNVDFKTNTPLMFPEKNPILIINYGDKIPQPANWILNNNIFYYKDLAFQNKQINITGYGDFIGKKKEITSIISILIILMLPMLALIVYFYMMVWYFAFALAAAILVFVFSPLFKYRIDFKPLFNSAMYGISLSIALDLIFFAIGIDAHFLQYLPVIIYTIFGMTAKGMKIDSKKKNKYIEVKERF